MIHKIVRYKVKRGKVEEVKRAIIEFVELVAKNEPHTLYEANQADDGVTFIHIMSFPDKSKEEKHKTAVYTMKFVESLYPNCEEEPVFLDLKLVKSTSHF